jgi:hypothetical protein
MWKLTWLTEELIACMQVVPHAAVHERQRRPDQAPGRGQHAPRQPGAGQQQPQQQPRGEQQHRPPRMQQPRVRMPATDVR